MVTIWSVGLDVADPDRARALHLAVDVHRAGAALRDAAAVFGAGEPDLLADDPQQRRIGLDLHVTDLAVDVELCHERPLDELVGAFVRAKWFPGALEEP